MKVKPQVSELTKQVVNRINSERDFQFILTNDNHKSLRAPFGRYCPLTWYCYRRCNVNLPTHYGVQALMLIMYIELMNKTITLEDVIDTAIQIIMATDNRGGHDPEIRAALMKEKHDNQGISDLLE